MTRPLASLLWAAVLLVPPARAAARELASFLWPNVEPFVSIASLSRDWVPFTVFLAIGYVATAWGSTALARHGPPGVVRLFRRGGGPSLRGPALAVTAGWVVLAIVTGQITYPLLLVALLVVVAFVQDRPADVLPAPAPLPLPTPPAPLPSLSDEERILKDADERDRFLRFYRWLFNEEPYHAAGRTHRFACGVAVPRALYDELRARDHAVVSPADYVGFAEAQLDDERIAALASRLRRLAEENSFDELDEIHLVMAFTLSLSYAFDEPEHGGEYPRYPVEMLVDKRGDCEDFSILCGTLLARLGHRVAIVIMDIVGTDSGHAALGVVPPEHLEGAKLYCEAFGREVYYCEVTPRHDATTAETTATQWWLGMEPPKTATNFQVFAIGGGGG